MKLLKLWLLLLIIFCTNIEITFAQGFTPPSDGKAVIYLTRITTYGRTAWFKYFDNDKYLGKAKGQSYVRYECNPGENLIWISCDNREFLKTNIKAGETYIVIVDVYKGFNAVVGMTLINPNDVNDDLFNRAKELINNTPPYKFDEKDIAKGSKKLIKFIDEELAKYKSNVNDSKHKYLSSEIAISTEMLH